MTSLARFWFHSKWFLVRIINRIVGFYWKCKERVYKHYRFLNLSIRSCFFADSRNLQQCEFHKVTHHVPIVVMVKIAWKTSAENLFIPTGFFLVYAVVILFGPTPAAPGDQISVTLDLLQKSEST